MFNIFQCKRWKTRTPARDHPGTPARTFKRRQRLLPGLLFSTGVGLFAYRRRSLSRSGVVGAMAAGSVTVGMGGWSWGLALIYFFASSSLLSHFRSREKERTAADKFSKGSQRDFLQVMANGGVATTLSLAHGLTHSQPAQELLQAGYTGALATANGDTWATELGVLNTRQPRLITTGKLVAPGTSGGITLSRYQCLCRRWPLARPRHLAVGQGRDRCIASAPLPICGFTYRTDRDDGRDTSVPTGDWVVQWAGWQPCR